jgi:hypothetical protein
MVASCTTRALPSGLIDVRVAVYNSTALARPAVVYGPALRKARYLHPVLSTEEVAVRVGKSRESFPGWFIPRVETDTPTRIVFHVERPTAPSTILAHEATSLAKSHRSGLSNSTYVVRARSWDVLKNDGCTVG